MAINTVETWITTVSETGTSVTICVDSQLALKALSNQYNYSLLVQETQCKLRKLKMEVNLQWVKAYVDTVGNELMYQAAKQESSATEVSKDLTLPSSFIKYRLRQELLSRWQHNWDNLEEIGTYAHYLVPHVFFYIYLRSVTLNTVREHKNC